MFQNGMDFNPFLWERKKYIDTENIMKLLYRVSERGDGWDREWSTKQSWFLLVTLEVF